MFNTKEKKERALGTHLFLKSGRCLSPKCVMARRPHRPGQHGLSRRGALSEFGSQLKEKQKIKFTYGVRETYFKKIFEKAEKSQHVTGEMMINLLERRLDNVVYRLGIGASRSVARHLVSHGHIVVNNRKVTIPSYEVRVGDVVAIRPQSKANPIFKDLATSLAKYNEPTWLLLDKEKLEGKVKSFPKDFEVPFDVNQVVDYYSK